MGIQGDKNHLGLVLSGQPVLIQSANIFVTQPKIKDIVLFGEEDFLIAVQMLIKMEQFTKMIKEGNADFVHIDVMDGIFVPNISFGACVYKSVRNQSKLFFDVHLMITEPQRYIEDFVKAGADSVTVHVEATEKITECIELIHSIGIKAGLALNPETDVEKIMPYVNDVDMILVMQNRLVWHGMQ